jgi:hypothetical protein
MPAMLPLPLCCAGVEVEPSCSRDERRSAVDAYMRDMLQLQLPIGSDTRRDQHIPPVVSPGQAMPAASHANGMEPAAQVRKLWRAEAGSAVHMFSHVRQVRCSNAAGRLGLMGGVWLQECWWAGMQRIQSSPLVSHLGLGCICRRCVWRY